MAVRTGNSLPHISSEENLKAVLLAAKTVTYSSVGSGVQFLRIIERLGIAGEVRAKHVATIPGTAQVGDVVASGKAEVGVHQQSELLPIQGITIVGPLPGHLQIPIVYMAATIANAANPVNAARFAAFLRSEAAKVAIRKSGMRPPP